MFRWALRLFLVVMIFMLTLWWARLSPAYAGCVPGKQVDKAAFFKEVAAKLENPRVPESAMDFAINAFLAWEPFENTNACWNPLATTWRFDGSVCQSSRFNSAGVQNYSNRACGILATANTLNYSLNWTGRRYQAIRRMMAKQGFNEVKLREEVRVWVGSEAYARQLVAKWKQLYYQGSPSRENSSPPAGYTFCAWENSRCDFSGVRDVAYGANGRFVYREGVRGGVDCNNRVFGDPIVGVFKACYVRAATAAPQGPTGYTFCSWENKHCNFSGVRDVAYGANGRFVYRKGVRGGVDCNNRVFGDPIVGVYKACYVRASSSNQNDPYCGDKTEPNNTWNQGFKLKAGRTIRGYICPKKDPDWFQFKVRPGEEVRLRLSELPKDYDMALFVNKKKVALSDRSGTSGEEIIWRADSLRHETTAYLKVYGWDGAWSSRGYKLRLEKRRPQADAPSGNIAPNAHRSPDGPDSNRAFDGRLNTFWREGLGHGFSLTLSWDKPMRIERILIWDRPQNSPDNNQINRLTVELSNGKRAKFGMDSQGRRCADIVLGPAQTVRSITLKADDASGHNGLSEVEIWTGEKQSGPRCGNQYYWRP